jgi:Zn-finger nucleic acid-binding protein
MTYSQSNHACPRCLVPLYIGHASGVTLHGCGRCGGVWLASACARRVAEALPSDAIELAGRASKNAQAPADTSALVKCPICARPMTRTRAAAAGVELDVCGVHGTWYDRDELAKIAQAISTSSWGSARTGAGAAVGVAAGTAIAAGAVVAQSAAASSAASTTQSTMAEAAVEIGTEVVLEVAGEGILEGAFAVVGGILGAIFD